MTSVCKTLQNTMFKDPQYPIPLLVHEDPEKCLIVKGLIGKGAYGKIFRAEEIGPDNKGECVIKVFNKMIPPSEVRHELKCIIKMNEICKKMPYFYCGLGLVKIEETDPNYFKIGIKFELLKGYVPLYDYLGLLNYSKSDVYDKIKEIMRQIVDGLKGLHSTGILHNDLHLKNILINKDTNQIKIIDYGICSLNPDYVRIIGEFRDILRLNDRMSDETVNKIFKSLSLGNPNE